MGKIATRILVSAVLLASACSGDQSTPSHRTANPAALVEGETYAPAINPADFSAAIDNPYLPLIPGTVRAYVGSSEEGREREVFFVTYDTKEILGVTTTVVHDKVYLKGVLHEDTFDWFAQDGEGNVWYFGEDSRDIEKGKIASRAGSWEAGVDGAQPGIVMPADPRVGDLYRQEFYQGEAEDTAEVLRLDETVSVPHGDIEDVLVTEDRNPLEPGFVENKFYARGIGVVKEQLVQGGEGSLELTNVETIDPPQFASIQEAVAFIQTKLDVPVVLPSHLPKSARLSIHGPVEVSNFEGRRGASLRLDFGVEEYLFISYGFAGFDGCPDPRPIDILGQPGMIQEHQGGGATIVWPVPTGSVQGRYGLDSYTLPADRLIRMAESMERARAETRKEQFPGC